MAVLQGDDRCVRGENAASTPFPNSVPKWPKTENETGSCQGGSEQAGSGRHLIDGASVNPRGPDRSRRGPDPPQSQGGIAMKVKTNVKAGIVGGSN